MILHFRDHDVVTELSQLHEKFVIVPADKASNNYTFVCKKYYVDILIEGFGLHLLHGNPTYNMKVFSASGYGQSLIGSQFLWETDKWWRAGFALHLLDSKDAQNPYKHRFIVGSSKGSTKPLSVLLTKLLSHIKQGLQKYCKTPYSRSGINEMWILKNSKELLGHLKSPNFNLVTSIESFDFSTLFTTIPHQKLKSRLTTIIPNSFIHTNGNRRYKVLVLGRDGPYYVKEHSDSKTSTLKMMT